MAKKITAGRGAEMIDRRQGIEHMTIQNEGQPRGMSKPTRRPFQGMSSENWINLAIAGLLVFYLAQFAVDIAWNITCGHVGVDFCTYWSAGQIANRFGFSAVYNPTLLSQVENSIFPKSADPALFVYSAFAYLPVFILVFQPFALLTPEAGYWLWTILNLAILIWYIRFFSSKMTGKSVPIRLLMLVLVSLPVFSNVFYGQVEVWLTVCVGEFMRSSLDHKPFRAGLWLGGLLLKPQALILIGLILLLHRSLKELMGLVSTSGGLLAVSWLMVGSKPEGLTLLLQSWLQSGQGMAYTGTESMMNWRMLGLYISKFTNPWLGYGLAVAAMLATAVLVLRIWRRPFHPDPILFTVSALGIFSATDLVAWHSHVHMAMILIPALIYLRLKNQLPQAILDGWTLMPALLYIAVVIPENLMRFKILPLSYISLVYFMRGAGEFGANIYLLWWAIKCTRLSGQSEAMARA